METRGKAVTVREPDGTVWLWDSRAEKFKTPAECGTFMIVQRPGSLAFCEVSGLLREVAGTRDWNELLQLTHQECGTGGADGDDDDYRRAIAMMWQHVEGIASANGDLEAFDRKITRTAAFCAEVMTRMED